MAVETKLKPTDFDSHFPTWCPGCGDFSVLLGLKKALAELGKKPHEVVVVSGIGCSGKLSDYIKAYGFHGIHGRVLPVAQAIKLVNPKLTVIGVGGDGDGFAIGGNHFIHACRRNIDITYIVMDNQIYGLTKGQASPTSLIGHITVSTPYGVKDSPIDPIMIALANGATFVARTFSGDGAILPRIFIEGIKHRGFSFIDDISPCVTFNKFNTYEWYREHIEYIDESKGGKRDYNVHDRLEAIDKVKEVKSRGKIPVGIIFIDKETESGERYYLKNGAPIDSDLTIREEYLELLKEFE